MPDLLLELFSEEIPARMQRRAAEDLRKLVTDALVEAGLAYEGAKAFVTPRRLALTVHGLPARSPDRREERKGPRVGAPQNAIDGFLKAAGLASIDQAKVQADKKGDFYLAVIERLGRPAEELIAGIVPRVVRSFPWPKSMRWGVASAPKGTPYYGDEARGPEALAWVRPLHSILCTFGPETSDPEVVPFVVDGIRSGNTTRGHRFMAPGEITVRRFDDYAPKLEKARVVLDADRRKDIILHGARDLALALGLELIEDEALLEEVAGLVEWPVVLVGAFDEAFLKIPPEVIRATIRANQKCFVLWQGNRLAPRFILVANIEASDGGKAIVAGNERVIRARLADARHFWETDLKPLPDYRDSGLKPLDQRLEKLKAQNVVFHDKLGTQGERVERIARLARELASKVGADPDKAERAARLAKADLVSEMVGEFPELQGLMGRYYAEAQGEDPSVAAAIEDHYKPVGPSDRVPTDPVAIAVALADKLDLLVGFWAIDEKPTGSKDPYALRRAALGVIRIVLERQLRVSLAQVTVAHLVGALLSYASAYHFLIGRVLDYMDDARPSVSVRDIEHLFGRHFIRVVLERASNARAVASLVLRPKIQESKELLRDEGAQQLLDDAVAVLSFVAWKDPELHAEQAQTYGDNELDNVDRSLWHSDAAKAEKFVLSAYSQIADELLAFFADRLKVQLREQGARHDLVDAVFALGQDTTSPRPGRERSVRASELQASLSEPGEGASPDRTHPPHPERAAGAPRSDLSPPGRGDGAGAGQEGGVQDDLLLIVHRVEALGKFLDTEDGAHLLTGYRRAANILRDEEKKSGEPYAGAVDPKRLVEPEEKALYQAIDAAGDEARAAVEREDFDRAMSVLARLRAPIDAFFDEVLVNDPDAAIRANRLRLLNRIREATLAVADFSKVEG